MDRFNEICSKIASIASFFAAVFINEVCYSQPRIALKLVQTFGDTDKAWIAEASDIAADERGRVYIADKLMQSVDVFDKSGKLVRRFGKKGKGPGEFESPSCIACFSDKIAVADFPAPRIQVFDKNFGLTSTIYTQAPIGGMRFTKDGDLLVFAPTGPLLESAFKYRLSEPPPKIVTKFSPTGIKSTGSFQYDMWFNIFWLATSHQSENCVLASSVQNKVEVFNADGKMLSNFSVPGLPDQVKFKDLGGGLFAPEITLFFRVAFDRRDNVFLLSEYWAKGEVIYVVSRDGTYRTVFSLPESSMILYIDNEDNLYLSANQAQVVKKYKMLYTGF